MSSRIQKSLSSLKSLNQSELGIISKNSKYNIEENKFSDKSAKSGDEQQGQCDTIEETSHSCSDVGTSQSLLVLDAYGDSESSADGDLH